MRTWEIMLALTLFGCTLAVIAAMRYALRDRHRFPLLGCEGTWRAELDRQLRLVGLAGMIPEYSITMQRVPEIKGQTGGTGFASTFAQHGRHEILFSVVPGFEFSAIVTKHECLHGILKTQLGLHGHPVSFIINGRHWHCVDVLGPEGMPQWRDAA